MSKNNREGFTQFMLDCIKKGDSMSLIRAKNSVLAAISINIALEPANPHVADLEKNYDLYDKAIKVVMGIGDDLSKNLHDVAA